MWLRLLSSAPDGFLVGSFAGDDWRDCKDYVRAQLGIRAKDEHLAIAKGDQGKSDRVRAIWTNAIDPQGTLVEAYLASRSLALPAGASHVIRFHPACPWRDDLTGEIIRVPAMIASLRNIVTDELTGIHRTRLSSIGEKIARRMLGIAASAAIKLDENAAVTLGVTIGEGIETTLAARQMGFKPAWALGSVGAIAGFPILPGIEALTILAETDDNGASARAIDVCKERWHAAGREILVASPRIGGDMNDALRGAP